MQPHLRRTTNLVAHASCPPLSLCVCVNLVSGNKQWCDNGRGEGLSRESQRGGKDRAVLSNYTHHPEAAASMGGSPRSSMQPQGQEQREQREHRRREAKTCSRHYCYTYALACLVLLNGMSHVPRADGQQMDPAAMQRQIQQQMGGSPGGGGAPPPNRIGENRDVWNVWGTTTFVIYVV